MPKAKKSKPLYAREILPKIIPTDYRYHILRFTKGDGKSQKALRKSLGAISAAASTRKIGFVNSRRVNRDLHFLKKNNMIKETKKGWKITDFGKKILDITTNSFFKGEAPSTIETFSSTERVTKHGREVIRYGPLTSTFSGAKSGESMKKLLDMVDLHRLTKKEWLTYGGQKELEKKGESLYYQEKGMVPISATRVKLLLQQKLIETEKPLKWSKKVGGSRSQKPAFFTKRDIYVHKISPSAKEVINEIEKLSEKDIKDMHLHNKTGPYSFKDRNKLANFLKEKKINPKLAEKFIDSELQVLYWLNKGKNTYHEIARKTGTGKSYVKKIVNSLESKGLIKVRPMRVRVTLEKPETQRIVNYLEALEDTVQEESKNNPKFRKKMFGM